MKKDIFDEMPEHWGLRGDSYFWKYLQEHIPEDMTANGIKQWIKNEHYKLTGKRLTLWSTEYVEEFAHGGMSSGRISGEWWLTKGIPLLKSRLPNKRREFSIRCLLLFFRLFGSKKL